MHNKTKHIWLNELGTPVGCGEKIKVMQQNLEEFSQIAQDLLDDAVLMEISATQVKQVLMQVIQKLPHYSEE